jgi:uncharacterized protein YgiM (DUF1202 family)
MKKLAAASIALLFVLSPLFSACNTTGNSNDTTADTGVTSYSIETTAPESTADTTTEAPVTTSAPVTTAAATTASASITFTPVDKTVYVTGDNVNVRSAPSASGDVIATLHYGDSVRCVGTSTNWYKIVYAGKEYYITSSYVTFDNITGNDFEAVNDIVYVSTDVVSLRKGPSTDTEVLQYATKGTALTRVGKNANWSKVNISGTFYYVSNSCLSATPVSTSATTTKAS